MGNTTKKRDTIYLDQSTFDLIENLAHVTKVPRSQLYREAIQMILDKYEWTRVRATDGPPRNIHKLRLKKVQPESKPTTKK